MATIWDDDAPELKISAGTQVTEGPSVNARFMISSAVEVTSLTVNYTPVSANFIETGSGTPTTTIPALTFTGAGPWVAPLDIPVHDDDVAEDDGTIMVTLNEEATPATTYTVAGTPDNAAEVNVADDDSLPLLRISAPTTGTAESAGMVDFVITTTRDLGDDFLVRYDPSEVAGDFLDESATPTSQEAIAEQAIDFSGSAGTFTATLSVPIHNDSIGEDTGEIQIELLLIDAAIHTYQIATDGTQIVTATIWDDDAPVISIADAVAITESSTASVTFPLTSLVAISSPIEVYYTLDEDSETDGDFIADSETGSGLFKSVNFNDSTSGELVIPIVSDDDKEASSTITVTLEAQTGGLASADYNLATPNTPATAIITDDDSLPELSIANATAPVAESYGSVDFVVSSDSAGTLTIHYQVSEVSGADFLTDAQAEPLSKELTFAQVGGTDLFVDTLSVDIDNDDQEEATGQILVTLLAETSLALTYRLSTAQDAATATATIWDDEAPVLEISAGPAVTDGIGASAMFIITSQVQPSASTVSIDYTPESDAFLAVDVSGAPVTNHPLTFTGDGPYTAPLEIVLADRNSGVNGNGNVKVTLNQRDPVAGYYVKASGDATVDVYDNDDLPTISIVETYADVVEGSTPIEFVLNATGLSAQTTLSINYTATEVGGNFLADAVQTPPTDITVQDVATSVDVLFTDSGDGTYTGIIPVTLDADEIGEISAPIQVTINPDPAEQDAYTLSATNVGMVRILDNDAPELTITAGTTPIIEGEGVQAEFTITSAVNPGATPISIDYTPVSANYLTAADSGVKVVDHPLTFTSVEPYTATLQVDLDNDDVVEASGNITVTLNQKDPIAGFTVASNAGSAVVAITDDDEPALSFEQLEVTKLEGGLTSDGGPRAETTFEFKIMLSAASEKTVTANWETSDLTTTTSDPADPLTDDYLAASGTETFMPGDTEKTISITVYGDMEDETDEVFYVILRDTANNNARVDFANSRALGIIENDDQRAISIFPASGMEADGGTITFQVKISPPIEDNHTVSVSVATIPNPLTDTAVIDDDYISTDSGTEPLIFDQNNSSREFTVELIDDEFDEVDETFTVVLSNAVSSDPDNFPVTLFVDNNSAIGTIIDDDTEPTISLVEAATPIEVAEGDTGSVKVDIPFTVSEVSGRDIVLSYRLSGLSDGVRPATSGFDFTAGPDIDRGTITIPAGDTTGNITIEVIGDNENEGVEHFEITIVEADGATISGETTRTIMIMDNVTDLPRLSLELVSEAVINEGEVININVVSGETAPTEIRPVRVFISVDQNGSDFIAFRIPRLVEMTSNSANFRIRTLDDGRDEENGTLTISIANAGTSFSVDSDYSAVHVSVNDNDTDGVSRTEGDRISVASNAVSEILNVLDGLPQTSPPQSAPPAILPMISVNGVTTSVDEGAPVQFNISGNENLADEVVVEYTLTPQGDFFDELSDDVQYVKLSGSQQSAQVEFATTDDTLAEQDGALTLTLLARRNYELSDQSSARVIISDQADRQQRVEDISSASQDILPDLTGAIAARTLGVASDRIGEAFSSTGIASKFMYDGKQDLTELLTLGGEALNGNSMTLREVLGSSSFAISLFPEAEGPSMATIWGLGDYRGMASGEGLDSRSWDADVFTGHLGLDAMVGNGLLVGISAALIESDIDHTGATVGELAFKSRTTALNPYLGWTSSDQDTELRAVAGYGVGEIDIEQSNYELQTVSNTYHTIGISGNQRIYASDSILEGGTSELSITGQSWYARQNLFGVEGFINSMQTDASHYRIGITGSHTQNLVSGSNLKPTISHWICEVMVKIINPSSVWK